VYIDTIGSHRNNRRTQMVSQQIGYHIVGAHSNPLRPGKIVAGEGHSRIIVPLRVTANPNELSTFGKLSAFTCLISF
jgi:hypothetical protein